MSDEPATLAEGMTPAARGHGGVLGHVCEHAGCGKDAGWGFAKPRRPSHWFCFEHRADGEGYL
ncbi:hypothetical protein [Mesorhizobium sp. INR15]|uniref:hypothetical protein n=1 Tax=Mesorhizobium sp. INR15 TaxID=2654248 RepID=UPI0018965E6C|nr:hypothetical protein [Mesorhizobium sp. INR15]QPC94733.1 hypothetical protein GA829_31365 [Mesorhizobium sp. INR15]